MSEVTLFVFFSASLPYTSMEGTGGPGPPALDC